MSAVAVHEFKIEVENTALSIAKAELVGATNLGISIDGNREEWTTLSSEGWKSGLVTGKGLMVSMDVNVDYSNELHKTLIEKLIFAKSRNHNGWSFTITFPKSVETATTPASLTFVGSINPSDVLGGESTDVSKMTFEVMANGKPTYTKEVTTKR